MLDKTTIINNLINVREIIQPDERAPLEDWAQDCINYLDDSINRLRNDDDQTADMFDPDDSKSKEKARLRSRAIAESVIRKNRSIAETCQRFNVCPATVRSTMDKYTNGELS